MKIVIIVMAGLVAMLAVAAAADLPRKAPPPRAAAPIGKYRAGNYPVGKYPQPFVTKSSANRRLFCESLTAVAVLVHNSSRAPTSRTFKFVLKSHNGGLSL